MVGFSSVISLLCLRRTLLGASMRVSGSDSDSIL